MEQTVALHGTYLIQLTVFLVWLVGAILAITYRRRHPGVSALTLIAISMLLVASLASTYLTQWLPFMLREQGLTVSQIGWFFLVKGTIQSLVTAVSWGLVIWAIFGWRRQAGQRPDHG